MANTFYIDGYNVIYRSKLLRPIAEQDFERAREELIDRVAEMCTSLNRHAVIVFDGRGKHLPERVAHHRHVPGLEVLFAPSNTTADAVIERFVYKAANRIDLVVVSGDRGLRDLCRNMGALVIDADNFLQTSSEIEREVRGAIERTRVNTPAFLGDTLDAKSVAALEALKRKFGGR